VNAAEQTPTVMCTWSAFLPVYEMHFVTVHALWHLWYSVSLLVTADHYWNQTVPCTISCKACSSSGQICLLLHVWWYILRSQLQPCQQLEPPYYCAYNSVGFLLAIQIPCMHKWHPECTLYCLVIPLRT